MKPGSGVETGLEPGRIRQMDRGLGLRLNRKCYWRSEKGHGMIPKRERKRDAAGMGRGRTEPRMTVRRQATWPR